MSLAQDFKKAIKTAINRYMGQFKDNKPMSKARSKEVARFLDLLGIENPLQLYKAIAKEYQAMDLPWWARWFEFDRSALRKEIREVYERYHYRSLLDEQVFVLMAQAKNQESLEKENLEFKQEVLLLKEQLVQAEARAKALEEENTTLKSKLKLFEQQEEKANDILAAHETIRGLERSLSNLEQERNGLRMENQHLRGHNQKLCAHNLDLLKSQYDSAREEKSLERSDSSLSQASNAFGFKMGVLG